MTQQPHNPALNPPTKRPSLRLLAAAALLLAGVAYEATRWFSATGAQAVPGAQGVALYQPAVGLVPFDLRDHRGAVLTPAELKGRWWFLFFGYTHCPDVCASTMLQFAAVDRAIGLTDAPGDAHRFLFVSVDPQRDDAERLASYVSHFGSAFVGATGEPAQLAGLEEQLDVYHRYGKPSADGHYLVQHSSYAYLVDPEGRLSARLEPPFDPLVVARLYADLAARGGDRG